MKNQEEKNRRKTSFEPKTNTHAHTDESEKEEESKRRKRRKIAFGIRMSWPTNRDNILLKWFGHLMNLLYLLMLLSLSIDKYYIRLTNAEKLKATTNHTQTHIQYELSSTTTNVRITKYIECDSNCCRHSLCPCFWWWILSQFIKIHAACVCKYIFHQDRVIFNYSSFKLLP